MKKEDSPSLKEASIFVRGKELIEGVDFKQEGNKLFPISELVREAFQIPPKECKSPKCKCKGKESGE